MCEGRIGAELEKIAVSMGILIGRFLETCSTGEV